MTVLGFRGPLDSKSYMPTGVSLKVVNLIGCIRVCACVRACLCARMHTRKCVCACELNCIRTVSPFVCAQDHVCVLTSVYIFAHVCVRLTFS